MIATAGFAARGLCTFTETNADHWLYSVCRFFPYAASPTVPSRSRRSTVALHVPVAASIATGTTRRASTTN